MASKVPCIECQHSHLCRYMKDVVNTMNDIYKQVNSRKEGRLPITINVTCDLYKEEEIVYKGEEIEMTNNAGVVRVWEDRDFGWIPDETIAENLVRAYLHEELGVNVNPYDGFGVYIVWQCYILGNRKYLIATTGNDNMYFEATYDSGKDVWYLDRYDKKANFELKIDYDNDNAESDILVKNIIDYK